MLKIEGEKYLFKYVHFRAHILSLKKAKQIVPMTAQDILTFIKINNLIELYPYIDIALRILLCTSSNYCSPERSFSTLKRFKYYLRFTIGMDRLNSLTILNIYSNLTREFQYYVVIEYVFVHQQATKKKIVI